MNGKNSVRLTDVLASLFSGRLTIGLAFVFLTGCASPGLGHYAELASPDASYSDADLRTRSKPIDYLDWLCTWDRLESFPPVVTFDAQHYGWIKAEDIPALIESLESKEPCRHAKLSIGSFLPKDPTTRG